MFEFFQSQEIVFLQFHLEPFCLKELDIIYFRRFCQHQGVSEIQNVF
jgi:hypothetical protein